MSNRNPSGDEGVSGKGPPQRDGGQGTSVEHKADAHPPTGGQGELVDHETVGGALTLPTGEAAGGPGGMVLRAFEGHTERRRHRSEAERERARAAGGGGGTGS